jgi:RNA polymerase sigma-70 factor (ECF subfamily)
MPQPGPEEIAHARLIGEMVDVELARLPERQRVALWLCAVEGLSYREIAGVLETSEKSVKALVHRARAKLAERMSERGTEV